MTFGIKLFGLTGAIKNSVGKFMASVFWVAHEISTSLKKVKQSTVALLVRLKNEMALKRPKMLKKKKKIM